MLGSGTLTGVLEARTHGGSTMLIHCETPVSFAEMAQSSRRMATGLRSLGVDAGDRVAIWMPTAPAWLVAFFACARLGAIAVAVNTRFVARELTDIVGRSGARVLVYWPGFERVDYASILAQCDASALPALQTLVAYEEEGDLARPLPKGFSSRSYRDLLTCEPMAEDCASPWSPCLILTTSGTTRAPKFVVHDQGTLLSHAGDVVRTHGLHADSVLLLAPPICGAFGICVTMAALAAGRPLVTAPVWDPAQAARWIDAYRVTHAPAVDDAIAQLLEQNERTPAFPTLEFCGFGAFNPAQEGIVERAQRRGLCVVGMYGTSEIQGLFARQSESAPVDVRSLGGGRPASGIARVRVRDPQTGLIQPHGGTGELEVFAPSSRMVEYFGDPEATRFAFTEDGWYRTGDLGYTRDDGSFVYLARLHDQLRLGGFLVSPLEIESVIQECKGVELCQVVDANVDGVPRPVAFVRMAPGTALDEAATIAYAAGKLARYKVPVRIFPVDDFPVTEGTNGNKIQKSKLRDLARARIDPSVEGEPP